MDKERRINSDVVEETEARRRRASIMRAPGAVDDAPVGHVDAYHVATGLHRRCIERPRVAGSGGRLYRPAGRRDWSGEPFGMQTVGAEVEITGDEVPVQHGSHGKPAPVSAAVDGNICVPR